MKIKTLIAASLTATLLGTGFSYAQTVPVEAQVTIMNESVAQMPEVQALIEELKAQGYTSIEIRRTLLGRAKITAEGPAGTREVVMSTATGEVMRDMAHGADHGEGNHGMDMGEGSHDGEGEGDHDGGGMSDGSHGGGMSGGSHGGGMAGGADGSSHGGGMAGGMGGN